MEIILIKDVDNLGYTDQIVNVRPGYANNCLIPQGFAKSATTSARKILAENLKQRAHKEAKFVNEAEALAAKINEIALTVSVKAEEGRIFGSVTSANISEALATRGVAVDRKAIIVDAIKVIGEYEATVKIYKDIKATVKFSVIAE